jgi:hypothetical protein
MGRLGRLAVVAVGAVVIALGIGSCDRVVELTAQPDASGMHDGGAPDGGDDGGLIGDDGGGVLDGGGLDGGAIGDAFTGD